MGGGVAQKQTAVRFVWLFFSPFLDLSVGVSIKRKLYYEIIGIVLFLSPLILIKGNTDDLYPCTAHGHILNSAKFKIQFKRASFTIIKMTKVGGDGGCIFADTITDVDIFQEKRRRNWRCGRNITVPVGLTIGPVQLDRVLIKYSTETWLRCCPKKKHIWGCRASKYKSQGNNKQKAVDFPCYSCLLG